MQLLRSRYTLPVSSLIILAFFLIVYALVNGESSIMWDNQDYTSTWGGPDSLDTAYVANDIVIPIGTVDHNYSVTCGDNSSTFTGSSFQQSSEFTPSSTSPSNSSEPSVLSVSAGTFLDHDIFDPGVSITVPRGVSELYVHNRKTVFIDPDTGVSIARRCPTQPGNYTDERGGSSSIEGDEAICYSCTDTRGSAGADCNNPNADPITMDCYSVFSRTCTKIDPDADWIVYNDDTGDDELFTSSHPLYAINNRCNPTDSHTPDGNLIVTESSSKIYKWDDNPPICVRGGYDPMVPFGNTKIVDADIQNMLDSYDSSTDDTLIYSGSSNSEVYTGAWTNREVQAKGICHDAESGCDPSSSPPVYSDIPGGLGNLQVTFDLPVPFTDNANNSGGTTMTCPSTTARLSKITRTCSFVTNTSTLVPDSCMYTPVFGSRMIAPLIDRITPTIEASVMIGSDMTVPDILLQQEGTSTPGTALISFESGSYLAGSGNITITLVDSGSSTYTTGSIWEHWNGISGIQKYEINICRTISFTGLTLNTDCVDNLTIDPTTLIYSTGVSLTAQYNAIGAIIAPHSIVINHNFPDDSGIQVAGEYQIYVAMIDAAGNTNTGSVKFNIIPQAFDPDKTILVKYDHPTSEDSSKIIYSITGSQDVALGISYKPISPCGQSSYRNCAKELPHYYANAIDTQTYKLSLFDRYDNPVYGYSGFHLYDFSLTQSDIYTLSNGNAVHGYSGSQLYNYYHGTNEIDTNIFNIVDWNTNGSPQNGLILSYFDRTGIYLDQVHQIGPRALFINASGGILSNSGQTGTTDIYGALKFDILSYTPGEFQEQFQFHYRNWNRFGEEVGPIQGYIFPELAKECRLGTSGTTPIPICPGTESVASCNLVTSGVAPLCDSAVTGFMNRQHEKSSFRHILTGAVDLYTTDRIDIGTANDIRINLSTTSPIENTAITGFTVSNFLESIISLSPQHFIITNTGEIISGTSSYLSGFTFDTWYLHPTSFTGATGSFIPEQVGGVFSDSLNIKTFPHITITFSGYTTQYYMSDRADTYGSGVSSQTGVLNRIYIEGLMSTVGKDGYVNMKENIDMNSADIRNMVHKNATLLTRNRTPGSVINRIKYLSGNVNSMSLSDMDDWDVLIIKGGNLIIGDSYTEDTTAGGYIPFEERNYYFNSGTTSFDSIPHKGIIVLRDENRSSGGNIYIKPDVRFIGASLFADESIHSVRYNDNVTTFSRSNSARTFLLNKQLIIFGSVYSKNTVGGAVLADSAGEYVLPWNETTDSLDKAVDYDLSFLRMNNSGYDPNSFLSRGHNEFVVIFSDSRNTSHPLPGFMNKK